MNSIKEMQNIINREFDGGMKGIRFFVEADASTDGFSHDFCALENAIANRNVEILTKPCS